MIEILENLDLLSRPNLDLAGVEVNGIALGAPAATVPRGRIASGMSPVIARYRGGTDIEGEYYAADGRSLTLDEIIDDVVRSDGFLYGVDKINYKVRAGAVVGFAISGPHLSHFAHLTSYEEFLAAFGRPDRVHENEAYGDLMSYEAYYWGSRKHVTWDAWEDRVSFVNLGDFEGNSGP
ncbi:MULTISPECIES: hypothetical protein [Streptomyces]|uniref:Uncharacterized protein n=1 Tax=Streptomyces parvus TaxID=66428 RepID=A0A5D4JL03_9ACTN|nr:MULTISPECIES: hypothetical protein [Streptomyces]MCC8482477.1 hypothetical protein [Streptomyces globisporus]PVC88309.1 hypothetical protein DBP12_29480 [Streptomyces sp. CS014]TYR65019.1 hypothetical protein FY004_08500 [Streptomyces parvus]